MTEVITRPNGKPYRPRLVVAQVIGEDDEGVLVLGTHDLEYAQTLADQMAEYTAGRGFVAVRPWRGWFRDGFANGRRQWVTDEVRGRAGVCFAAIEETLAADLAAPRCAPDPQGHHCGTGREGC